MGHIIIDSRGLVWNKIVALIRACVLDLACNRLLTDQQNLTGIKRKTEQTIRVLSNSITLLDIRLYILSFMQSAKSK